MNDDVNIFELYTENAKQQKSPTMFVDDKGTKRWRLHGKFHREDGPAIEYASGSKSWWMHGNLHREDGPAIEYANGNKSWWVDGQVYDDVDAWAEAALRYQGKECTDEMIEQKIQCIMYNDVMQM